MWSGIFMVLNLHCVWNTIGISAMVVVSFRRPKMNDIIDAIYHHHDIPDSKVHGANMGPIRGRRDPGGPPVGAMNLVIWDVNTYHVIWHWQDRYAICLIAQKFGFII